LPFVAALVTHWGADLRCDFANEALGLWFGQPADTFLGQPMQAVLGDEEFALNWPHIEAATLGQGQQFERVVVDAQAVERNLLVFFIPDLGPRPAGGGRSRQAQADAASRKDMAHAGAGPGPQSGPGQGGRGADPHRRRRRCVKR
jgi:hypothetical protein